MTRRRRPSPYMMERMSMPQSGPFGYYFPFLSGNYDSSSYDPSYSEGQITQDQINTLMQAVNSYPLKDPQGGQCKMIIGVSIAMAVGLVLLIIGLAVGNTTFLVISIILFVLIVVGAIAGGVYYVYQRTKKREAEFVPILDEQRKTTFANQNIVLKQSKYGTYIYIQFAWKGAANPASAGLVPGQVPPQYNLPPTAGGNPYVVSS